MSPKSEHVLRELLTIAFRATPRGIANGTVFASLTLVFFWPRFPASFLALWFVFFAAFQFGRISLARAFLRIKPPAAELGHWVRYAAIGYAAVGLTWGTLCASSLYFVPGEPVYALWVFFLIALFAVLQTQTTGSHPLVFRSFVLSACAPVMAATILFPGPFYPMGLIAEALFIVMALLVGNSGNRYVTESIRMRYENLELLEDLRRQKEEIDRANDAKTRFLAAASHDLRQPMQAIALLVESLQDRVQEPATRNIVESMRNSVVAMSSLLNEILDISKLDAGTVKPQPTAFPVSRVLDRLRSSFANQAAKRYLTFRVRPSDAVIETDEVLLYRILANLTNNALRYTRKGGVLVACRARGDDLSIEVWDSGVGIASDQLQDIFREFYQVANPLRDREQGLGLGLAIVERTARLLGLPLLVRSRQGRGSVFSVTVKRGVQARPGAVEGAAPETLEGCKVLVVENERDIRAAMTLLLEGWKCRVAAAASGAELDDALARLGAAPDAVIADYGLAGDNGIVVIDRVRKRHPAVEGVLVSGDVSQEALKQAQLAGYPMLHKPVRPARLRAMLGAIRREHEALRA